MEPIISKSSINGVVERSETKPLIGIRQKSEVAARPKRRILTAAYKRRIVEEAEQYRGTGEMGAFLRREGVWSSQLTQWRRLYEEGGQSALSQNRGRKKQAVNPLDKKVRDQERQIRKLQKKLDQAEAIIDIQKKVAAIMALGNDDNDERL